MASKVDSADVRRAKKEQQEREAAAARAAVAAEVARGVAAKEAVARQVTGSPTEAEATRPGAYGALGDFRAAEAAIMGQPPIVGLGALQAAARRRDRARSASATGQPPSNLSLATLARPGLGPGSDEVRLVAGPSVAPPKPSWWKSARECVGKLCGKRTAGRRRRHHKGKKTLKRTRRSTRRHRQKRN